MTRILAAVLCLTPLLGCGAPEAEPAEAEVDVAELIGEAPRPTAVLDMGELGEIHVELFPELAPRTVENFVELAGSGYYDGTYFHRVMPGFMIQGGDPNTKNRDARDDGKGGPDYTLPDEFSALPHVRGIVSMAHKGQRNTANSQFFIVHADSRQLDGDYTAFGRVVRGIEVVDAITELEIDKYGRFGPPDRPYPVSAVVESVRILPPATPAPVASDTALAPAGGSG